jgi:DNA-binding MarR family transcriptional regulator
MPSNPDAPNVEKCDCSSVRKAARQISRHYDTHLQPPSLRITQCLILAALHEFPGAHLTDIADRLNVETTVIGKMVATLRRDGIVRIERLATDGRARAVHLTVEGQDLLWHAFPLWQAAQRKFEARNGRGSRGRSSRAFSAPLATIRRCRHLATVDVCKKASNPFDPLPIVLR